MVKPGGHVIMFRSIYPVMDGALLVSQLARSTSSAGSTPLSLYARRIKNQSVEQTSKFGLSPRRVNVPFENGTISTSKWIHSAWIPANQPEGNQRG